jgi:hypothetical protein
MAVECHVVRSTAILSLGIFESVYISGWSGVRVRAVAGNVSAHHRVQTGSRTHPASYPEALSVGVKRPGREADHSPPSSAKISTP